MKKFLPFFAIFYAIFAFQSANAQNQTLNFEYDAAGNCVLKYKTIVLPPSHAPARPTDDTDTTENSQSVENQNLEDMIGDIKITILPNPTKGLLQVDFENKPFETSVSYTIMETNGKYLTSGKSAANPLMLDFSGFQKGVYLLRITVNQKSETYKIIRE